MNVKIADGKPFGQARFNPATAGYKAPSVPDYLKGHLEVARPAFAGNRVADSPADAGMRKALSTFQAGFNGDVEGDTPF